MVIFSLNFDESLAVVLFILLINVGLHTRIKYGNMVVTNISTVPYKIAYWFLIIALCQAIMLVYMVNIHFTGVFAKFIDYWINSPTFNAIFMAFECNKIAAILIFLNAQSFEFRVLSFFVIFQHSLRLEQLHIEKERYLKIESRGLRLFKITTILLLFLGLICILNSYAGSIWYPYPYSIMAIHIMWIICGIIIFANTFIRQGFWLLLAMYRFYRHEFYIHKKRLIAKVLITYSCMLMLIVMAAMAF